MAKHKSTLAASTAAVPSWTESVAINTGQPYDENNPHSWLRLRGSPAGATGIRVLHGTLRLHLGDHPQRLSAEAFCLRKCRPVDTPDALAITALRAEVLVPRGIDDAYADPLLLPRLIDHSLARETAGSTAILCYCTITDPHTQHLHEQWSTGRQIVANLVARFTVPMLLVQHAPHQAGSGNAPHLHVMAAVRKLSPRGFGAQVPQLIGDKARDIFVAAWRDEARR